MTIIVMSAKKLAEKCEDIAKNYKTLYVMGCIGASMTEANKKKYIAHHPYNADLTRKRMINNADSDTFGFDCVCLIKSVLWGWKGVKNAPYGGAEYACNGVPDINADAMIGVCKDVSTDFSKIAVGEAVWCKGHIGVYIGNGLAVECTPSWKNCVQITAVGNIGIKSGYNTRKWTKHGKLPYVEYLPEKKEETTAKTDIAAGDIVTIKQGAKYGGLNAFRGRAVPTAQLSPKKHTVKKVQVNKGVKEALLQGIMSWVAVDSLTLASAKITEGCKVKVRKGAKTYNGIKVASFVYNNVYTVDDLNGKRAVLDEKGICTAFNVDDLILQ